ncbi:hypothetical protein PV04_05937 [Phialophora macrospora]|uniref:peptidylprolyl isomerase n=1 Tax=Phialophora macrospora TaxID=1851006 RepID=A0A0D2FIN6_9EURO|nr:hypothetical protein PV04_05937 [Phialophora macrospora]
MATQLDKKLLSPGNNKDYPKVGDEVAIEYTGWLYDSSKANEDYKGNKFDSSVGRGEFKTQIGVGRVIQGWDQGVPQMSLGEKSRLTIPGHMAYGDRSVHRTSNLFCLRPAYLQYASHHQPVETLAAPLCCVTF